jgi:hypothetical protein
MANELIVAIITAVTTSIIGPIAVHYVKLWTSNKKKDPLSESIAVNQTINVKLETIKEQSHADRVWLAQFHNGGNFYPTGKSIQKFSLVYELLSTGVFPCQHQFQNIPVSLFSKSINTLHKGKVISIPDTSLENKQFEGFTSVIPGANVKSTYLFPLYTIKDEFVGIVGVDYSNRKRELTDKQLVDLELEMSAIGGVLNNYLKV